MDRAREGAGVEAETIEGKCTPVASGDDMLSDVTMCRSSKTWSAGAAVRVAVAVAAVICEVRLLLVRVACR